MNYAIGDLHYFDKNIIKTAPRNFDSVGQMNSYMLECWNDTITELDTVFVNGDFIDFSNCSKEEGWALIDQLHGNIVLIVGNHDKPYLSILYEYRQICMQRGQTDKLQIIEFPIVYDDFWIISHEPMFVSESSPYANIFAHVHLNPMYRDVSARSFCISAERIGYTPILLETVKSRVKECR